LRYAQHQLNTFVNKNCAISTVPVSADTRTDIFQHMRKKKVQSCGKRWNYILHQQLLCNKHVTLNIKYEGNKPPSMNTCVKQGKGCWHDIFIDHSTWKKETLFFKTRLGVPNSNSSAVKFSHLFLNIFLYCFYILISRNKF
jgi:hypothetical protein